jgi:hypothetical protein
MSVLKSVVRSWEFQLEQRLLERLLAGLLAVVMEAVRRAVGHRVETEAEAEADMVKAHHKGEVEVEVDMGRVRRQVKDMDRLRRGRREVRLRECHNEVALKGTRMIMNSGLMVMKQASDSCNDSKVCYIVMINL